MVVYLRPLPRGELLSQLAELGIFVNEVPSAARARWMARSMRPDIIILVGSDAPSDRQLARDLQSIAVAVLVVVLPPGTPTAPFVALGINCLTDDDVANDFAARVAPEARQARRNRERQASGGDEVAGELQLHLEPPELVYQGRSVALDDNEMACLVRLLDSPGLPVPADELRESVRETQLSSRTRKDEDIATVVKRLQKKMAQIGRDPSALAAVEDFGYVLLI
jgi:DNA-binding response OmpR family regulator